MPNVKLLDCTLRDGGYINQWQFGQQAIKDILFDLSVSHMDIIECGFFKDGANDPGSSLFAGTEHASEVIPNEGSNMFVAMIAIGEMELDPAKLSDASAGHIGGVRLTFHQHEIEKSFAYGQVLKNKGYKLFMQPVGGTHYSDKEMIDLVEKINALNPYAFYLVDTLGMMYPKDLLRQFYLVDHNLAPGICVGYHSHNNLQMAFANAQALVEKAHDREVIIDCSCNGMGRGAGNLCTELFMDYMNRFHAASYDILPVLEIIDQYLVPIQLSTPWGYSPAYYLSAAERCHPNYAGFLMTNRSMNIRTVASILDQIEPAQRHHFNKKLITKLYADYQDNAIDDLEAINDLRHKIAGRDVLVLAPGQSMIKYAKEIEDYIKTHQPFVIAVNFIPDFETNMIFIGNNLRFDELFAKLDLSKAVLTSNIKNAPQHATLVNYSDLTNPSPEASDSSGIMVLKLLIKLSVSHAALAGYDGFSRNQVNNYAESSMAGLSDPAALKEKSLAMQEQLKICAQKLSLKFITPTRYHI